MLAGLWRNGRQAAADVTLVVVLALVAAPLYLLSFEGEPPYGPWWYALGELPFLVLLLARRRYPVAVLAVCALVPVGVYLVSIPIAGQPVHGVEYVPLAASVAVYSALVHAPRIGPALRFVAVLVVLATAPWELLRATPETWAFSVTGLVITAGPALLGLYVGARRRLLHSLAERAERAEREHHLVAEQARAAERAQLAGEMHDVVTHRVSLIVLQAGALRITAGDEETRRVAEELRAAGCQALEELRDLVGVLRADPGADADPEDGSERASLPDLAGLVAASGSAGVPVELVESGDATLASPVVGRTAYRIVREALTNVHKHAPGASTRVHVRYGADGVRLVVRNAPASGCPDADLTASGSGTGLDVLRRRVELVHGTLRAGPDADGGFRVDAELPAFVPTSTGVRDGV